MRSNIATTAFALLVVVLATALPHCIRAQDVTQDITGTPAVSPPAGIPAAKAGASLKPLPVAPLPASANKEQFVVIDYVCAWPNLSVLPSGEVVAFLFNQPCHGFWEGDVECWASANGRFWEKRGMVTRHEPGTVRMNHAAGMAGNGDLIAIVSGWNKRGPAPSPMPVFPLDSPKGWLTAMSTNNAIALDPWVCRSSDGGKTWTRSENTFTKPAGPTALRMCPYGSIMADSTGRLYTAVYVANNETNSPHKPMGVWFYRSDDDGKSWNPIGKIGTENLNETAILHMGDGRWLAAARTYRERAIEMFQSSDDGLKWSSKGVLTSKNQHPAHLLRLADGRILMSYADRAKAQKEILARFSEDEGETWGPPLVLATFTHDGGYPSSVQLADQTVVTAFYAASIPSHQRYHMGVVRWRPTRQ